jgi:phosphate acetyltransferase
MQTFLIVPTNIGVGLTSACLGLIRALDMVGMRAGFMKPFVQAELNANGDGTDHSRLLVSKTLDRPVVPAIEQCVVERMLGDGHMDELLEQLMSMKDASRQDCDVLIVEGLVPTSESSYAPQLNAALAQALDASVIIVTTADLDHLHGLADRLDLVAQAFGGANSERVLGYILNRVKGVTEAALGQPAELSALQSRITQAIKPVAKKISSDSFHLIGVVPFNETLSAPRTFDVAKALDARVVNAGEASLRRVKRVSLCARTVKNILGSLTPGTLIVTPGDREDILVAASLATMNGVPLAGIVLTGDYSPEEPVLQLCNNAFKAGLPVLSVASDSFETVLRLSQMSSEIPVDDVERTEQVMATVARHLDIDWLKQHFALQRSEHLSPSAFRYELVKKAQVKIKRIVLPEGAEPRTVEAAVMCQNRGIAQCILLAKRDDVEAIAQARGIILPEGLEIIEPESIRERYIAPMVELRKGKLTSQLAEAQLQDTVVLGTMMLALNEVDGLVSGAIHTTANTVRPAFQLIKTAPNSSLVSSVFFMLLPEQVVVYGDCAINPDPTAIELAEIAIQSADSAAAFGIEPRVAMISYSTGESGTGSDVDKVREATRIAQERRPDLMIDGPLQYDAAAIESVGLQKAPNSKVAGRATVFVFPDLNTGNTTYKAVQRSANVVSVGPMLQGLNKPVNDLSRGALVEDIVYTIALTAIQAAG